MVPRKKQTIPRLELTAARIGANLAVCVQRELDLPLDSVVMWTDSAIVLGYIKNRQKRFHTFVANRVAAIQEQTTPDQWRHIDGKLNPADLASRGIHAGNEFDLSTWVSGPKFLYSPGDKWPKSNLAPPDLDNDPEVKKGTVTLVSTTQVSGLDKLIARCSNYRRLLRVVAWVSRVLPARVHRSSSLTAAELDAAETKLLQYVQQGSYARDLDHLRAGRSLNKGSQLSRLAPRLDDGILVVGGRLQSSDLPRRTRHPVILPGRHHVTSLLIRQSHESSQHSGVDHVLAVLREKYWITSGRGAVKRQLKACVRCKRLWGKPASQQMAPLLREQVTPPPRPFKHVGIDFFGPFQVKFKRGTIKRWGCVFTCLASRAIHLEVVHSMSAASFIAAFQRFTARRGRPSRVFSDNGTNMVGGERELREELERWDHGLVDVYMADLRIDWSFNPPYASHRGGAIERMIRSIRKVLLAAVGTQLLTDEQLQTVMCEAERVVNSRPLTYTSSDPRDCEVLTPAKLLLLDDNLSLACGNFDADDHYATRWWRRAQHIADVFWKQWVREYLPQLQQRSKWKAKEQNLKPGDVVMLEEIDSPRGAWPLARVTDAEPGRDGLVRTVTVKARGKLVTRAVNRLCPLELQGNDITAKSHVMTA